MTPYEKHPESEYEKQKRKDSRSPWYRRLTLIFLATTILFATLSIIIGVKFQDYKNKLAKPNHINLVMDIRLPNEWENKINFYDEEYDGPQIPGHWYGSKLVDYLKTTKVWESFVFRSDGVLLDIKGIKTDWHSSFWFIESFHTGINTGLNEVILNYDNYFSFVYTTF